MAELRHDRIFPLSVLSSYPGRDGLDTIIYLPYSPNVQRRIWLMTPTGMPTLQILDTTIEPRGESQKQPRWIDYGNVSLPFLSTQLWSNGDFVTLRVRGLSPAECQRAFLVITPKLDLSLDGCTLEEAERTLWGIARSDAGTTTITPSRVTAGTATTFVIEYRAGPKGLPGGARIRFVVPKVFAKPQTTAEALPGWLTIIRSDRPITVEQIESSLESHEQWDVMCRVEQGLEPHTGFAFSYSTDQVYLFPHTYCGTDRALWYSPLAPFAAAVALSNDQPFLALSEANAHSLEFTPGAAERLHLFLPGRRFVSEQLTLRGTFTDHYRNVPPRGPVEANIELYLVGQDTRLSLGTPARHFIARHRFELALPPLAPGVYRVFAYDARGKEIARSNPLEIIDESLRADRLYWGEIHGHTEMSDGVGEYSELYRHAKFEGCLDFAAATDHSEAFSENQWEWMQDITNRWNEPGRFVTLVGYEWAGKQMHRNLYTSRDELPVIRGRFLPTSQVKDFWKRFEGDAEIVGGGHAGLGHGMLWEQHNPNVERFMEVYSMWGASDFRDSPLARPELVAGTPKVTVNEALMTGARLGFTGGGDCHEGHVGFSCEDPDGQGKTSHGEASIILFRCGMLAAQMPQLDRASLIHALRERQTYATTGARILLEFGIGNLRMGDIGHAASVECRAVVHGVQPIRALEIIRDGKRVWQSEYNALDVEINWRDPNVTRGEHYYYLHVVQGDGERAWSSPIWVTVA